MSVVDTVEILKGQALDEDEYFKATTLGWCIELVSCLFLLPLQPHYSPSLAASLLLGSGRHHGCLHHPVCSALLVLPPISWHDHDQQQLHA